ncbi:MAG: hypothetical protein AB8F78_14165 [Saprospiraceae bacterium]
MKSIKIGLLLWSLGICVGGFSQVGILTQDPTKTLDVNGEARIRVLPDRLTNNVVTADADGNLGQSRAFFPTDIDAVQATDAVNLEVIGNSTVNDLDLGLSVPVVIPAGVEALVVINYSVPMGVVGTNSGGYYGIRFMKDGVEEQAGSRKFSILVKDPTALANMVTVGALYIENVTSSAVARTFTYSLDGYVEQTIAGTHNYRFNMWTPTGINYNWGKATLSKAVYYK